MSLKSNQPLEFWDRFGNAVDKFRKRKPLAGHENAFNSGLEKLQKARSSRDIKSATSAMNELLGYTEKALPNKSLPSKAAEQMANASKGNPYRATMSEQRISGAQTQLNSIWDQIKDSLPPGL